MQEQKALVRWLSYHHKLKDFYCKLDNEGKRSPRLGANLKLLGLRPGASDLFIYYPVGKFCGLWLEMKRSKEYTHSERSTLTWRQQAAFIEEVKSVGYAAFFAYGWIHGKDIIEQYLNDKSNLHNSI